MMRFSDALTLALTKFRIRKWRAINSALLAALISSAVLMGMFAYFGVKNSISDAAPKGFQGRNLAAVEYFESRVQTIDFGGGDKETFVETIPSGGGTNELFEEQTAEYDFSGVYELYSHGGLSLSRDELADDFACDAFDFYGEQDVFAHGPGIVDGPGPIEPALIEEEFDAGRPVACDGFTLRDPEIFDGYADSSLTKDGTVPIVVTYDYAEMELSGLEPLESNAPNENVLARADEVRDSVLGKTYTYYYSRTDESGSKTSSGSVDATVVGVIPKQSLLLDLAGLFGSVDSQTPIHIAANQLAGDFAEFVTESRQRAKLTRIVEFTDSQQMRMFVEQNCNFNDYDCSGVDKVFLKTDPYLNYQVPFEITAKKSWKFFRYVVLFFVFIAAASIYGTMGKIIVDSRRETGVFRAIGASRTQIGQIYITYITIVSLIAFTLSVIIALLMNWYLTTRFADNFETEMALVTGTSVAEQSFSFIGFNTQLFVLALLATVLVGWLGSLIPIIRSLRRDPIRYLREE